MIWFLQLNGKHDNQASLSKLLPIEHIDNEKKNPGSLVGEMDKEQKHHPSPVFSHALFTLFTDNDTSTILSVVNKSKPCSLYLDTNGSKNGILVRQ